MAAPEDSDPVLLENVLSTLGEDVIFTDHHNAAPGSGSRGTTYHLFNRQRPIHEVLGGGKSADVILWRKKYIPAAILSGATAAWIILEYSGYTVLCVTSNVLLILILGLFAWANVAVLVHRPPPHIPELQVSEEMVLCFASALRVEINNALAVAHDIALGKDLALFLKVVAVLWVLSLVGGWFHLLTLIYLSVVFSHTLPVIYESYELQVDSYAKAFIDEANKHYRTIKSFLPRHLPKKSGKGTKTQ